MMVRWRWTGSRFAAGVGLAAALTAGAAVQSASAQTALGARQAKGQKITEFLSTGGLMAVQGRKLAKGIPEGTDPALPSLERPTLDSLNELVNDPCLDPPHDDPFPSNTFDVIQSEPTIGVLNPTGGRPADKARIVVGYNDSEGFSTNTRGVSGFSYSTDGGKEWIDGGGLPVKFPDTGPPPPGGLINDQWFGGNAAIGVDHARGMFYYTGIYRSPGGYFTLGLSRGQFRGAAAQGVESVATQRCLAQRDLFGVPVEPGPFQKRPIWKQPVEVVQPPFLGPDDSDFLDKPWLTVDQKTGAVYVAYLTFQDDGGTPLELVVSYDQGRTWTAPRTIVPNLVDTVNTGVNLTTTPTGRLVVTWWSQTLDITQFDPPPVSSRIESAYTDDDGLTFSPVALVDDIDPQGEPLGYNRERDLIINAPFIAADKGADDGVDTPAEQARAGFGNVYVTYHDGLSNELDPPYKKAAVIKVARSTNGGVTWDLPVQVNDDATETVHVFPNLEVDKDGWVFVSWIDRRRDPVQNIYNDTWAAASTDLGQSFGENKKQSDVAASSWFARADAQPNFGDYNDSALIDFKIFVQVWADGRFEPPGRATVLRRKTRGNPNVLFSPAVRLP